ncbi:phage terminase small subunit P27 family [Microtetraspora malaysiensis]|uniref:Phage terminase small subunit P27 family n=1 Tax=Microtetraspora malaysiensis TaxID=161358 RepID=A0ABW6T380_9ACTN
MGRTPQPVTLKLLNGTSEGRDSGGRKVAPPPAFRRLPPKPPTWLTREARAEWKRVVSELTRLDLLKESDRATLAVYCETWARFVEATRTIQREGMTIEAKQGLLAHPAVAIARAAGRELRAFATQFGLTPASEGALSKGADDGEGDDNPFA